MVFMTNDYGSSPAPVMEWAAQVAVHHCYRVLPTGTALGPAVATTRVTSIRLEDLTADVPLACLWDGVSNSLQVIADSVSRLDVLIVSDMTAVGLILTAAVRDGWPQHYGSGRLRYHDLSCASQEVIDECLALPHGARTPRAWTRLVVAVVRLQNDGTPTATATTWLDSNPSALLYYYVPDGVETVRGRPALGLIKPPALLRRDRLYTFVMGPILEKARNRDPENDPEGLRHLLP
jgi:hypothetical protein